MTNSVAPGSVFPPRDEWDVAAFDGDEIVAGYRDYRAGDPTPGPNHSPSYRWGWTNRQRDVSHKSDGFEGIRYAYIQMARHPQ